MLDDKPIKSEMIRCGRRTYFFDIKVATNGDKYLRITETRLMEEGQPRKRNNIMIFPEDIERFKSVFNHIWQILNT